MATFRHHMLVPHAGGLAGRVPTPHDARTACRHRTTLALHADTARHSRCMPTPHDTRAACRRRTTLALHADTARHSRCVPTPHTQPHGHIPSPHAGPARWWVGLPRANRAATAQLAAVRALFVPIPRIGVIVATSHAVHAMYWVPPPHARPAAVLAACTLVMSIGVIVSIAPIGVLDIARRSRCLRHTAT